MPKKREQRCPIDVGNLSLIREVVWGHNYPPHNLKLQDDQGSDSAPGDIRMIEVVKSSHIIET